MFEKVSKESQYSLAPFRPPRRGSGGGGGGGGGGGETNTTTYHPYNKLFYIFPKNEHFGTISMPFPKHFGNINILDIIPNILDIINQLINPKSKRN